MLTLFKGIDDERKEDEGGEHDVEFVVAGEDPTEALELAEESFDFVATTIDEAIPFPGMQSIWIGRNDRDVTEFFSELPSVVALVGPIHDQMATSGSAAAGAQKLTTLGCIPDLAGGQLEVQGAPSMRGNQMNLGGAAAA